MFFFSTTQHSSFWSEKCFAHQNIYGRERGEEGQEWLGRDEGIFSLCCFAFPDSTAGERGKRVSSTRGISSTVRQKSSPGPYFSALLGEGNQAVAFWITQITAGQGQGGAAADAQAGLFAVKSLTSNWEGSGWLKKKNNNHFPLLRAEAFTKTSKKKKKSLFTHCSIFVYSETQSNWLNPLGS